MNFGIVVTAGRETRSLVRAAQSEGARSDRTGGQRPAASQEGTRGREDPQRRSVRDVRDRDGSGREPASSDSCSCGSANAGDVDGQVEHVDKAGRGEREDPSGGSGPAAGHKNRRTKTLRRY